MKLEEISWDGDSATLIYAKGQFDKVRFCERLDKEFGITEIMAHEVNYGFARWIPRVGRDYDQEFVICNSGAGAFPITYVEI